MEFITQTIGSNIFQGFVVKQDDVLDEFVIKIFTNNHVERMLPMSVIRKDMDVEIRYNVTSLMPLGQLIKTPLSKRKVLNIFRTIIDAVTQCEGYMLDGNGIVFDEERIYSDIDGNVQLMYLPVKNQNHMETLIFLQKLVTKLQFDPLEDGGYVLKLMNSFNSGTVATVAEMGAFINTLDGARERISEGKKPTSVRKEPEFLHSYQKMPMNKENADGRVDDKVQEAPVPLVLNEFESVQPVSQGKGQKRSIFSSGIKEKGKEKKSKETNQPDKQKGNQFGSLFGKKESVEKAKPSFAIPGMNDPLGFPMEEKPVEIPMPKRQESFSDGKISKNISDTISKNKAKSVISNMDYGNTIMMNQNNSVVTVMLDESEFIPNNRMMASLTRVSNKQKMYIDKDIFRIGKESDYVDFYVGDNPTISRSHADILKKDGMFYLRDNNAKNHTYLNGEMVTPGSLVLLEDNAKIRLSNEEFSFQLF